MVRGINASVSRSRYIFSTFAAATTSAVPISVKKTVYACGRTGASQSPVAVVKMTRVVIRGLVSSVKFMNIDNGLVEESRERLHSVIAKFTGQESRLAKRDRIYSVC